MFYLDWMLTLIVFSVYPIAFLPMSSIGRRLRSVARRTLSEIGDMTSRLTELLAGARLIKAFRLESYATERLTRNFEQIFQLRMKAVRVRGRAGPALEALAGLVIAGVLMFAYWRIAAGVSTVGDFMGFLTALRLSKGWPPRSASTNCSTRSRPWSTAPTHEHSSCARARLFSTVSAFRTRPRRALKPSRISR
jgi:subfamily B ATP-binding cassette protein MsbA